MGFDSKKVYTTPSGTAVFPKLIKPDTKFNKEGVYSVRLKFDAPVVQDKFVADMTALYDAAYAELQIEKKKKNLKKATTPWKPEVEIIKDEEGNVIEEKPTGYLLFNFKLKATIKLKSGETIHPKPNLFDGKGQAIKVYEGFAIGGGSRIKVAFTVRPFFTDSVGAGISFQIKGVQVITLVEPGGISASACGFGSEEGGFVPDEEDRMSGDAAGDPSAGSAGAPDPTDSDF